MPLSERDAHQRVLITMMARLQYWTTDGELGSTPTHIAFEDDKTSPDIFWIAESNKRCQYVDDSLWRGAPDLIVEIVAPDTEAQDRGDKYNLYQAQQVFEYWIVNPVSKFIEVFVLLNRRYQRTGLYISGETFSSGVLNGRRFEVNDLLGIRSEA
jgi:Uma2 family endonuclease